MKPTIKKVIRMGNKNHLSIGVVLPKRQAKELGIEVGDFLKITFEKISLKNEVNLDENTKPRSNPK